MEYKVKYHPAAKKELDKLDSTNAKAVKEAIRKLKHHPLENNTARVKGKDKHLFRIRIGKYRAVYKVFKDQLIVLIVRVRHRKAAYTRF
jgi:mRNA interferase RelE/StbE